VRRWYPAGARGFEGSPGTVIPRYRGKRYEWKIGETTDDTEQTLALARAILKQQGVTHGSVGLELLRCVKSIHPGVSMWPFVQQGDANRIAQNGDGCGAAMRVSPVGILHRPSDLSLIIRGAYECAIPTHGGQSAICAAAAVAVAVSTPVDGGSPLEALGNALEASRAAETLRRQTRTCTIATAINKVYRDLSTREPLPIEYIAENYFPSSPETIVPLAISLALITQSAERTALVAANVGGDSDSVASIGGAIAGALCPETVNESWFDVISLVNSNDVVALAVDLAHLRH
jgi:ADP-ribosylglycohydrolase